MLTEQRHRVYHIVHDRRGRAACDQTDEVGHGVADERADPHEGEADHRPPDERPRARQLFAERHGRHALADAERRRQRNRVAADQNEQRNRAYPACARAGYTASSRDDAVLPRRPASITHDNNSAAAQTRSSSFRSCFRSMSSILFLPDGRKTGQSHAAPPRFLSDAYCGSRLPDARCPSRSSVPRWSG